MSYVVLFRTHFWDAFTERSFERIRKMAPGGDVYVAADETMRPVPCPPAYKLSHQVARFKALGLADYPVEQTMWYNGDYPLYSALIDLPHYDYYVMVEFDVVVNAHIDHMIEGLRHSRADVITHGYTEAKPDWFWKSTADKIYDSVYGSINPFFVISRQALSTLYYARLVHSQRLASGAIDQWPYCEAFIASELHSSGFTVRELTEFGPTRAFDWWPPYDEGYALKELTAEAFIHPVLSDDAYLRSLARYEVSNYVPTQRSPEAWEAEFQRLKGEPSARSPEGWDKPLRDLKALRAATRPPMR